MKFRPLVIEVASDAYVAGKNEDGRDFTAERFFIQAESHEGNRFRLTGFVAAGCKVYYDREHDTTVFEDVRAEARARAQRLVDKIRAKGIIDTDFWYEVAPVYGSVAFIAAEAYGLLDEQT